MPFQFPTTAPPPYEDQTPVEEQIIIKVRGNCGIEHASFEEWQHCRRCALGPPPLKYERFDR
jgi:hypothetical protein